MADLIPPTTAPDPWRNIRIKFDAKLLRVMAPFVAESDIRYYLNGLRIERAADKEKGIYLVATNGHMMAIYYDPEGMIVGDDGKGVILSLHPALLAAAGRTTTRFGAKQLNVIVSGRRVSLAPDFGMEHSEFEQYIQPGKPFIDGTFPDWRKVLPDFDELKPSIAGAWNVLYFAKFAKISKGDKYPGVTFWQKEHDQTHHLPGVVVQLHNHPNFVGIIMPMRNDAKKDGMRPVFEAKQKLSSAPVEGKPA